MNYKTNLITDESQVIYHLVSLGNWSKKTKQLFTSIKDILQMRACKRANKSNVLKRCLPDNLDMKSAR